MKLFRGLSKSALITTTQPFLSSFFSKLDTNAFKEGETLWEHLEVGRLGRSATHAAVQSEGSLWAGEG